MKKLLAVLCLLATGCNSPDKHVSDNHVKGPIVLDAITIEGAPYSRGELLAPIFSAMIQEENDKLRFDEPLHEIGQQDGKLRAYWLQAYFRKQKLYAFNGDVYHTMNNEHRPAVPQVCADFLIDTLDIAAGTWYQPALTYPKRILGKFDFHKQIEDAGYNPRSVDGLIKYFKTRPTDFQFLFNGGDGPEVGNANLLKIWLKDHDVEIGDIVLIRGRAPWDHMKNIHYHSLFITRLDDSGLVSMIIGNAGHVKEWSIEREIARAPKRHVITIIRMTDYFLKSFQN